MESRPAVQHFHDKVLSPLLQQPYPYNMVIDGNSDPTGKRRRLQAAAVRDIYESLRKRYAYAVVAGDFNDYPESDALAPLLGRTNLRDAMSLKQYRGTFPGATREVAADVDLRHVGTFWGARRPEADHERHGKARSAGVLAIAGVGASL